MTPVDDPAPERRLPSRDEINAAAAHLRECALPGERLESMRLTMHRDGRDMLTAQFTADAA